MKLNPSISRRVVGDELKNLRAGLYTFQQVEDQRIHEMSSLKADECVAFGVLGDPEGAFLAIQSLVRSLKGEFKVILGSGEVFVYRLK